MGRMKVLVVEPLKEPKLVEINHDLSDMRWIVGGAIECVFPFGDRIGLVCCADGIALGYPLNRALEDADGNVYDIVHGTFFLCGLSVDNFDSLPDGLAKKYMEHSRYPELFMKSMDGSIYRFKLGSGKPPKVVA